jgi:hypothetical protein
MKRWWRNEAKGGEVSGRTQFEGRTAEEAVARARKALGDSDALRCWKTRKGGVGGFFAREVYVASLTPPPGSEGARGKGSRTPSRKPSDGRAARNVSDGSARSLGAGAPLQSTAGEPIDPQDHLSGLVEATNDQLSLQSLAIPAGAFDQVLAEAEAALARLPASDAEEPSSGRVPPEDGAFEPEPACDESTGARGDAPAPEGGDALPPPTAAPVAPTSPRVKAATRQKPKARPKAAAATSGRPAALNASSRPAAPTMPARRRPAPRLGDLKPGLRSLGVPDAYLPPGRRPSLDLLADVMATLPEAGPLPTGKGAVVVVVGVGTDLARTVDLVRNELSLGQRDVLALPQSPNTNTNTNTNFDNSDRDSDGEAPGASVAAGQRLGRQIARRRADGRQSVVAIPAAPGRSLPTEARACLDHAAPDYVLLAVGAGCKRADVEHLISELPTVDALALWDLSATRTPAELLGVLPIALVDGETGSALGWTLQLAGRAVGWRR